MKRTLITFSCFIIFFCSLSAQQSSSSSDQSPPWTCGMDGEALKNYYQNHPGSWQYMHSRDEDIAREIKYRNTNGLAKRQAGGILTIPVVVHIIHNNGPENIPNSMVQQGIDHLNQAFRNLAPYDPSTGEDMEIEFCFASRDGNGLATNGIYRVQSTLTNMVMENDDLTVKNLSRLAPDQYLNIWLVEEITSIHNGSGVAGYAFLPASHGLPEDGVLMEARWFGSSSANSSILAHEVGHYLGLYHTFEGGCTNNNCLQDGDRICDTPPDGSTAGNPCSPGMNSCTTDEDDLSTNNPFRPVAQGGQGDQIDLLQDYMDYGDLPCKSIFTAGQKDRMHFFLQNDRGSLLHSQGCLPSCSQPIQTGFTASSNAVFLNSNVTFTNTSTNASSYTWKVNGQIFASTTNAAYTFTTTGLYTITLIAENGDQWCTDSISETVQVNCQAQASFTPSANSVANGSSLTFTNTSQNATAYEWLIDAVSVGTGTNLTHTFNVNGWHLVELVASDANCSDTTVALRVLVGSCISHDFDHWLFGEYCRIDFVNGNPVFDSTNAMDSYEATVSVSDSAGNLMFYANSGEWPYYNHVGGIWNRDHQLMPNGRLDSSSGCMSSRQVQCVQDPGNAQRYYLFTIGCFEYAPSFGLRLHIIDMTLDSGRGDLVAKNFVLNTSTFETIAATHHANGKDVWIVVGIPGGFETRLLTSNGVQGPYWGGLSSSHAYSDSPFSFSGDGTKMVAMDYPGTFYYMNFDNSTGLFSQRVDVIVPNSRLLYSCFSPSGRYLYVAGQDQSIAATPTFINRYDFWAANPAITAEVVQGPQYMPYTFYGSMRAAPDGTIYLAHNNRASLGTIKNADAPISQVVFTADDFDLHGHNPTYSFPIRAILHKEADAPEIQGSTPVCLSQSQIQFHGISMAGNIQNYQWTGSSNLVLSQESPNSVLVQPLGTGTDTLIFTQENECRRGSDTLIFQVFQGQNPPDLGPDTSLCRVTSMVLDPGVNHVTYAWSTGGGNPTESITQVGNYWVETIDSFGCRYRDSIRIIAYNPALPTIDLGPDLVVCDSAVVILDAGATYPSMQWQDGQSGQTYTAYLPGTYWVEAINECGDTDRDTMLISNGMLNIDLGADTVICQGDSLLLYAPSEAAFFNWQDGSTGSTYWVTSPGTYWLEVEDSCGRAYTDTLVVGTCIGWGEDLFSGFQIFPNPMVDHFWIRHDSWEGELKLELVDPLGRRVWTKEVQGNGGVLEERMKVDQLAKGLYMLRMSAGDGWGYWKIKLR